LFQQLVRFFDVGVAVIGWGISGGIDGVSSRVVDAIVNRGSGEKG
jgi:hypothetical protein